MKLKAFNGDRAKNLESIADKFEEYIRKQKIDNPQRRSFLGYCEQLRIIAAEIRGPKLTKEESMLFDAIKETDGAEIPMGDWRIAEQLRKKGLITLSSARGPDNYWKRATLC